LIIESLLQAKKISQGQHDIYMLFQADEQARERFKRMKEFYLMENPVEMEVKGVAFAYFAGRRSVIMDICRALLEIEAIFNKEINNNDDPGQPDTTKRRNR
jgi:hypothetical protein